MVDQRKKLKLGSSFEILQAIIESPYIAEAAVIGVPDALKGQIPLGLCVPKHGLYISIYSGMS